MSLVAMVLADRIEPFTRYYDNWMRFITGGRDALVRAAVLRWVQPTDRLLDVGCGTGTLAVAAARHGTQVVGIDRSRAMLRLAREKAASAGVSVELREGHLPLVSVPREGFEEEFDVATATFVLSELAPEEATLAVRAMAEAVRPGGRVIIADEAVSHQPVLRLLSALQRFVFALFAFAVLQELAPTHRHPLRVLLEETGLTIQQDTTYQRGSLRLVVGERPAVLPALNRMPQPLDMVLPTGFARVVLRIGAWFALPIPIAPGVYRIGMPGAESAVLLTGNFLASIEHVRRALAGHDGWVIVADTQGWNVWCASDAGLFTAEKAAALMRLYDVERLVAHRRVVIPRLGGRIRSSLAALTQWEIIVGPIEARDLPDFLASGTLTPAMRSLDRMYRLPERLHVGALTVVQLPLWLLPFRVLPKPLRRPVHRFALVASWVLPVLHYHVPGRTGIVKGAVLGCAASVLMLVRSRTAWPSALAVLLSAPLIGWIYQSTSPVIYWKRIWK